MRVSQPTPVNQKSLNAYLMGILNGLRDGEINPNQGIAIAKVASQINMTYNLSLKRTMVEAMLKRWVNPLTQRCITSIVRLLSNCTFATSRVLVLTNQCPIFI